MRKLQILAVAVAAVLFTGCIGGKQAFVIKTSENDKFADKSSIVITGQNNRVSDKSIQGSFHLDGKGLYVEPIATIKKGYKPYISLAAFHYNFISTNPLASNKDLFSPIEEIIFLVDSNERILVKMTPKQTTFGKTIYNSTQREAYKDFTESSIGTIDLESFKKIANAKTLDIKVVGGQHSQAHNNNELEKDFISNLKQFYEKVLEYEKQE